MNGMTMTTAAMGMGGMTTMDHSMMNHSMMNHTMGNSGMNHSMMNHTGMNMSDMGMGNMDHSGMDHSGHGAHNPSGSGHTVHDMPGMMMMMYFHVGVMETILFEGVMTEDNKGMAAACAIIFVAAILYEGIKFLREVLLQRTLRSLAPNRYSTPEGKVNGNSQEQFVMETRGGSVSSRMFSCSHLLQTVLHIIQVFLSYCLMLVFMTYNVWLCLAVVLGAGAGYFLFGWKRASVVDANEHCH